MADVPVQLHELLRLAASESSESVSPGSVMLTLSEDDDAMIVRMVQHLHASASPDGRPVMFDLSSVPFPLESAEAIGVNLLDPLAPGNTQFEGCTVLAGELDSHDGWDDTSVAFSFRWPRSGEDRRSPTILPAPAAIPRVLRPPSVQRSKWESQLLLDVTFEDMARPPRLASVILDTADKPVVEFPPLLHLALVRGEQVQGGWTDPAVTADGVVIFTPAALATYAEEERRSLHEHVVEAFATLADLFGVDPIARIVVARREDLPPNASDRAGMIVDVPHRLLTKRRQAQLLPAVVVRLASVWWGAGCRIAGDVGYRVEAAIALAAMAHVAAELFPESDPGVHLRAVASRKAGVPRSETEEGSVLRLAAALVECDDVRHRLLPDLTRRAWGMTVPAAAILSEFRAAGVDLPGEYDGAQD